MYVYFFERIARHKSGFHNFSLPFWGYSPTGMRDLPKVFRDPADASNPLFTSNRNPAINAGALINASTVDAGTALAQVAFNSFTSVLNGTPHGGVHVAVGGGMSSFQGAGRDPIFWLHHCNIDRLWEVWLSQGGGRVNPTDASWLNTPWNFYDETGATVSLTGAQIVDVANQLQYRYESDRCGKLHADEHGWWRRYTAVVEPPPGQAQRMAAMERGRAAGRGRSQVAQAPQMIAQSTQPSRLGASVVRVTMPISASGRTLLSELGRDSTANGRLNLVLEDVRVEGQPRIAYEIYIDLPANETPTYTGPNYAGNVNLFGPAPVQGQPQRLEPQIVPLSLIFLRLTSTNRWPSDSVSVTFVPRAVLDGQDPARLLGQATQATIQRILVRIE
jgi:tyrosinase